ncbi:hypothetical protein CC86DRAFT_374290 [Ophiobolus disseminans]|uniref:Uncharacterized protein n=1 Tax=Ophiobolus disseminans TaxID=1469910 RepID=A0A6A6ZI07_9PLEO|nr:hypothetical protein CC86DRAFT_374290 [Ophiobolus disseminans]
MSNAELKRPNLIRRASSGMRNTRWWQAMSCPYPGCTEHGIKQIFDFEHERTGSTGEKENKECASIEDVRKRESLILQRRLALIEKLPDHVLLDYTHLWRLLLHVFRPYKSHSSTSTDSTHHDPTSDRVEFPKISRMDWCSVINDISQGCSWLNWYILSIGPSPFIQQWSLTSPNPNPHLIRDMIWTTYANRSSHQIEVEREYASRFEFALRKRCLSRDRLKRLDNEVSQGRSIRTISLDCIPWQYDVHYTIARPEEDFPWYTPGEDVWLDEEWCVRITPGGRWDQPGGLWACMVRTSGEQCPIGLWGGNVAQVETEPGPLGRVPYLVYLGDEVVGKITPYRGLLRVVDWNF